MRATGHYVTGCGQAAQYGDVYRAWFHRPMEATFNVQTDTPLTTLPSHPAPHPDGGVAHLWLVKVHGFYAWAYRAPMTQQNPHVWELISKSRLPATLKEGPLQLEVLRPYTTAEIATWVRRHWTHSWHQNFPWCQKPDQGADSALLWGTIAPHTAWAGKTVLDFGTGWGYHAFQASKAGATVLGIDLDVAPATEVNDHIEQQDVCFSTTDPLHPVDIILYLSVHHQRDPTYHQLAGTLGSFRERAPLVFVELIEPPMFGTPETIRTAMQALHATHLGTYRHRIRGRRSIWKIG